MENMEKKTHIVKILMILGLLMGLSQTASADLELSQRSEMFVFVPEAIQDTRTISFAGYDWIVKECDFQVGPGPNYFSGSEDDVWVDGDGLHLTISEQDDKWYCTEVYLDTSLGYGNYIFQTTKRVDIIDPMMVLGLFTWDIEATEQHNREMTIEYTRWGNPDEYTNGQYVVQPCSECPGCGDQCTRFRVDLTDSDSDLTHYMVWRPGIVEISTYHGKYINSIPPASALVNRWTNAGGDVPEPGNEIIHFNFWLYESNAPLSGLGDEVVITDFSWKGPDWKDKWLGPGSDDGTTVTTSEVQDAIHHWLDNIPVDGNSMSATDIQKIITIWSLG